MQEVNLDYHMRLELAHPDYSLMKPEGCMNCLAISERCIRLILRPRTNERMLGFNFLCITRWTPWSEDEEDMMPEARRQEYEEQVAKDGDLF